jgi:cyclopropane-fatty-acyl-phospholipid synthase
LKKHLLSVSLIQKFIFDKNFLHQVEIFKISPNRVCFEQEAMDYYILSLEKV